MEKSNQDSSENAYVTDVVAYQNLIPGHEYSITGLFHVQGDDITATTNFIPETENGIVDVTFTFDSTDWEDKTPGICQRVFLFDWELCRLVDTEDVDMTVTLVKDPDSVASKYLGDKWTLIFPVLFVILVIWFFQLHSRKIKSFKDDSFITDDDVIADNDNQPTLLNGKPIEK